MAGGLGGLFGGGMPDLGEVQGALDSLSPEQVNGAATEAVQSLPDDSRGQLGHLLSQSGGASPGVQSGDPGEIGNALGGLLKGGGGLGALAGLLGGGAGAAGGGESGGGMMGGVMDAVGGGSGGAGGLDLGALMNNPLAKTLLAALIPAIMKAAGR